MDASDKLDALFAGDLGAVMLLSYIVLGNNLVTNRHIEGRYEMPVQAWSSLYAAAHFPGIRAKEIAQLFPRPQNTISRAISLLEARGWVRQEASASDKREKHVFATQAGEDALAEMTATARARQEELFAPLTPQERQSFLRLAAKIAHADALLASEVMRKG